MEKQTGKKPVELEEEVQVPEGGEFLWDVFWKMRREQAISYKDIAAYKEVTGIALSSWEIEALFRMDRAVAEYFGEQMDA